MPATKLLKARETKLINMSKKVFSILILILLGGWLITEVAAAQDSPSIKVDSIDLDEKINKESLDYGVLLDPNDNIPTEDSIVLFGHRTKDRGPFLRLDEIKKGDKITLDWPKLGKFNYTVTDTTIMPGDANLEIDENNSIYLITCDPIGSTENRLIVKGEIAN